MKKGLFCLIILLLLPNVALASEMSTSVPTNSQYLPGRSYGFQIKCDDIPNIVDVMFEWNGIEYPANSISSTYYYNLSGLTAGLYSYRWLVNNTSDVIIFSNNYNVMMNSSISIILTLNGTAGNRSYKLYDIAGFVASLNIPSKTIRLESSYPGFTTQTNTSVIYYVYNLTESGIYTLTTSWDGDQNYTSSARTYYFDSGPPMISEISPLPPPPVGYVPGVEYKFQAIINDATLTNVWFESNYSGSMKSYDANSDPPLENSSGNYWIILKGLGVREFSYRWHAKDSSNEEFSTNFADYQILKMNPLVMDVLPTMNVREGDQITATCFSINPTEIPPSKFTFYKDYELIENISFSTRMKAFLLTAGPHNFTCNTSGTGNYTNQSITRTIKVLSAITKPENITGELRIANAIFPELKTGESEQASFDLVNEMSKNIFNVTVNLTGIPSNWYNASKVSYIYSGETKKVKINFSVPSDAEPKTYSMTIKATGNTAEMKTVSTSYVLSILVNGLAQNTPPYYFMEQSNKTGAGEIVFSLAWSDDYGLSGYIFSSNITGEWTNDTWIPSEGTAGSFTIPKLLNISARDVVAWKIYSNDTSNEWSASDEYIVKTAPESKSDIIFFIAIPTAIIVLVIAIVAIKKRKSKVKEVEYIYSKEDIENDRKS